MVLINYKVEIFMRQFSRQQQQTQMIHWSLWYFLLTTLVIWIIGGRYLTTLIPLQLPYSSKVGELIVYTYLLISYISHLALLSFLVWILIVFPFIYCIPKRMIVFPVSILSTTLLTFFIVLDSNVFQLYRFHLNPVLFNLLLGGEAQDVFGFNANEWLTGFSYGVAILLLQITRKQKNILKM